MRSILFAAFGLSLLLSAARAEEDLAAIYRAARHAEGVRDYRAAGARYEEILDVNEEFEDAFERWEVCQGLIEWQGTVEGEISAADLVRLGEVFCRFQRFDDERAAYREAIETDPDCTEAHGHLALANYGSPGGDIVTVMKETMRFLETSPHRSRLTKAMADFRTYGLLRILNAELGEHGEEFQAARQRGDNAAAANHLIAAVRGEQPDAYATALFAVAGDLRRQAGDKAGARRAYNEALSHTRCNFTIRAHMGLAALHCGEGDLPRALAHLEAAVAEGSGACQAIRGNRAKLYPQLFGGSGRPPGAPDPAAATDAALRARAGALLDAEAADSAIRAEIQAACEQAGKEGKRVLLHWYGPYCPFVMAMEERFAHPDVRAVLAKHYVHVRMDQGAMHKGVSLDAEYGEVMKRLGVPSFFVLDPDGAVHTIQKDAELTEATFRSFSVEKIVAWLSDLAASD